ncbi:MAG: hypothetical protein ACYSX0_07550 [Planctomycetota bacterium]
MPVIARLSLLFLLLSVCACGQERGAATETHPGGQAAPPDRDGWWTAATAHASGQERILAPRELRALLAQGRRWGFDGEDSWWQERRAWVFARILEMDADDVEANGAMGRKTLQSIPDFLSTWARMVDSPVQNDAIEELLDRYYVWVQEERPIFLTRDEYDLATARMREARQHMDKLDKDPKYAALQVALARVRGTSLSDYPFVHALIGPFLVFYAAPDLQRIDDEDPTTEDERLRGRREFYVQRIESLRDAYEGLLADIAKLYPGLWKKYAPGSRQIHYQWIFSSREWYVDFLERLHRERPESRYRCGFFDAATGWSYLVVPEQAEPADEEAEKPPPPDDVLRESAVYLAVLQMLNHWARDPEDGTLNRLQRSRAYWLKEGWPSFLAARRMKESRVGNRLQEAKRFGWKFPPLLRVLERESRLELRRYREPAEEYDEVLDQAVPLLQMHDSFTDLAWLLVRHLNSDEQRPTFERYLLSQIESTGHGIDWFGECIGIKSDPGWEALERAVYGSIDDS